MSDDDLREMTETLMDQLASDWALLSRASSESDRLELRNRIRRTFSELDAILTALADGI